MSDNREKVDYDEWFESLELISYDKIVEILCDEKIYSMINFTEFTDFYGNQKTYQSVNVRDLTNDKSKTYKVEDQDPFEIEKKLYDSIEKITKEKNKEPKFGYIDDDWCFQYHCMIGDNWVTFPPAVEKKMKQELIQSRIRQAEFEKQKQAEMAEAAKNPKKMTLEIDTYDDGELPFEI